MHQAMKRADQIRADVVKVRDPEQRKRIDSHLSKKVKDLEMLSNSLVYRECEVLTQYKDKLQLAKENDKMKERQALLEDSDSDQEESKEWHLASTNFDPEAQQVLQTEQEDFEMVGRQDYVQVRGSKIARVARSLGQIQRLY